nr:unnamed protein product [Papilio xuthus]
MIEKLNQKYSKKPIQGDIYNLMGLKVLLDDLLLEYLTKTKNYKQNTFVVDLKIFIGIISSILACGIAYCSVNYDFEEYRFLLIIALSIYFTLNTIVWIVEKARKTTFRFGNLSVVTDVQPPSPVYTIMVYEGDKLIPEKYNKSIFDLFADDGRLLHEKVLADFENLFN